MKSVILFVAVTCAMAWCMSLLHFLWLVRNNFFYKACRKSFRREDLAEDADLTEEPVGAATGVTTATGTTATGTAV